MKRPSVKKKQYLEREISCPVLRREHECNKDFSDHPDRTEHWRSTRLRLLRRLETHDILARGRHTDRDCRILTLGDFHVCPRINQQWCFFLAIKNNRGNWKTTEPSCKRGNKDSIPERISRSNSGCFSGGKAFRYGRRPVPWYHCSTACGDSRIWK